MKHWAVAEIQPRETATKEFCSKLAPESAADLLIFEIRHHGHFNNVLTHVFHSNWELAQRSMERLLRIEDETPLTKLEANLASLLCGERGTTGKLMRPWVATQLRQVLSEKDALQVEHTWHAWNTLNMLLPVRFRTARFS